MRRPAIPAWHFEGGRGMPRPYTPQIRSTYSWRNLFRWTGERCRMPVEHGDDAAMGRHVRKQALDMRARVHETALSRALRCGPAGVEPVSRCNGKEADIAAILR